MPVRSIHEEASAATTTPSSTTSNNAAVAARISAVSSLSMDNMTTPGSPTITSKGSPAFPRGHPSEKSMNDNHRDRFGFNQNVDANSAEEGTENGSPADEIDTTTDDLLDLNGELKNNEEDEWLTPLPPDSPKPANVLVWLNDDDDAPPSPRPLPSPMMRQTPSPGPYSFGIPSPRVRSPSMWSDRSSVHENDFFEFDRGTPSRASNFEDGRLSRSNRAMHEDVGGGLSSGIPRPASRHTSRPTTPSDAVFDRHLLPASPSPPPSNIVAAYLAGRKSSLDSQIPGAGSNPAAAAIASSMRRNSFTQTGVDGEGSRLPTPASTLLSGTPSNSRPGSPMTTGPSSAIPRSKTPSSNRPHSPGLYASRLSMTSPHRQGIHVPYPLSSSSMPRARTPSTPHSPTSPLAHSSNLPPPGTLAYQQPTTHHSTRNTNIAVRPSNTSGIPSTTSITTTGFARTFRPVSSSTSSSYSSSQGNIARPSSASMNSSTSSFTSSTSSASVSTRTAFSMSARPSSATASSSFSSSAAPSFGAKSSSSIGGATTTATTATGNAGGGAAMPSSSIPQSALPRPSHIPMSRS
ncbi:hypothetical protein HK102_000425, partial [Quaeritorhiza haematococci]